MATKIVRKIINFFGVIYFNSVRNILPIKGHTVLNGVKMPYDIFPEIRTLDKYLFFFHKGLRKGTSSEPEKKAYLKFIKKGDNVVIIGGGYGVSTVIASKYTGANGHVILFEGSKKYYNFCKKTVQLNDTEDNTTIKNLTVGPAFSLYENDSTTNSMQISPNDLPFCDVLALDCEGAEYNILNNLKIKPRVIIVEIHPHKTGVAFTENVLKLTKDGYKKVYALDQKGVSIPLNSTKKLLVDNIHFTLVLELNNS